MKEALRPGKECVGMEQLEMLIEGQLQGEAAAAVRRHVESCVVCELEMALLEEFRRGEARPDEIAKLEWIERRMRNPALETQRRWWTRWFSLPVAPRWAMAAAVVLLIVAGGLQLRRWAGPTNLPDQQGGGVWRSGSIAINEPIGDIAQPASRFSWNAVEGAFAYTVTVTEVDGAGVWKAESRETRLTAPPGVSPLMQPRKTLVWRVTAKDAQGRVLAESVDERFRYMP